MASVYFCRRFEFLQQNRFEVSTQRTSVVALVSEMHYVMIETQKFHLMNYTSLPIVPNRNESTLKC